MRVQAWAVLVVGDGSPSLMGPDKKLPELFATKNEAIAEMKKWDNARHYGWHTFPVRVSITMEAAP